MQGPKYFDNHGAPSMADYNIRVTVIQDDVLTTAFIVNKSNQVQIGVGFAKRHPRDARNPDIGRALAVSRAFAQLAERYAGKADEAIHPEPDVHAAALRAMKRANRAEKQHRKNERRRKAREEFARAKQMTDAETGDWLGRAFGDWYGGA